MAYLDEWFSGLGIDDPPSSAWAGGAPQLRGNNVLTCACPPNDAALPNDENAFPALDAPTVASQAKKTCANSPAARAGALQVLTDAVPSVATEVLSVFLDEAGGDPWKARADLVAQMNALGIADEKPPPADTGPRRASLPLPIPLTGCVPMYEGAESASCVSWSLEPSTPAESVDGAWDAPPSPSLEEAALALAAVSPGGECALAEHARHNNSLGWLQEAPGVACGGGEAAVARCASPAAELALLEGQAKAAGGQGARKSFAEHQQDIRALQLESDACINKSIDARRMNRPKEAQELEARGRRLAADAKALKEAANTEAFRRNNQPALHMPDLDLHDLTVAAARDKVAHTVNAARAFITSELYSSVVVGFITGRGAHSRGGMPRIREAVMDWLDAQGLLYILENAGGLLRVQLVG